MKKKTVPDSEVENGPSSLKGLPGRVSSDRCLQILLLLTAAALLLRLYRLDFNSLWLDEAVSLRLARLPFPAVFDVMVRGEYNPPLFFWLEHAAIRLGDSEWMVRIIPAIAGTVTVPVFYILGKQYLGRAEGVLAAALLAFSPFHIYYSQEARPYVLALLFMTVCLVFLVKAFESGKIADWVLSGLFAAAAMWTHFYVIVVLVPVFLYALLRVVMVDRKGGVLLLSGVLVFVAACLPLFLAGLKLAAMRVAGGAVFGARGVALIPSITGEFSWYNPLALVVLGTLFVLGLAALYSRSREKGIFILLCIAIPVIASIPLSFMIPMTPRYLITLLPFTALGIAASYPVAARYTSRSRAFYLLLAVILVVNLPALAGYYSENQKETWREFSASFSRLTGPGDQVVLVPGYIAEPFDYYYNAGKDGTVETGANSLADLSAIRDTNGTVWVITTTDLNAVDPDRSISTWLTSHTTPVRIPANGIYLSFTGRAPQTLSPG